MQFFTASVTSSSSAAPPHLHRISRCPPFPHLHRRRAPHMPSLSLLLANKPPLRHASRRSLLFTPRAHGGHCHHRGHSHGHHGHGRGHGGGGGAAVMRVARAIGWADVADALRDQMQVCCISLGLLLMAAICPHVALLSSVGRLPALLIAVAYPLVGTPSRRITRIHKSITQIHLSLQLSCQMNRCTRKMDTGWRRQMMLATIIRCRDSGNGDPCDLWAGCVYLWGILCQFASYPYSDLVFRFRLIL